jgi:DNA-binding MarR family transcriptional regulator
MSDFSDLATNIHRLSTVLGRVSDRCLQQDCGFGVSQFKILWILHKHAGGVLQTNIADWLNQTEAAVSRQIGLLEQDGLIKKEVDPKNRRNHLIMLTSEGKKFAEDAMERLLKQYKPYFTQLSDAEIKQLNITLDKIFFAVIKEEHKEGK